MSDSIQMMPLDQSANVKIDLQISHGDIVNMMMEEWKKQLNVSIAYYEVQVLGKHVELLKLFYPVYQRIENVLALELKKGKKEITSFLKKWDDGRKIQIRESFSFVFARYDSHYWFDRNGLSLPSLSDLNSLFPDREWSELSQRNRVCDFITACLQKKYLAELEFEIVYDNPHYEGEEKNFSSARKISLTPEEVNIVEQGLVLYAELATLRSELHKWRNMLSDSKRMKEQVQAELTRQTIESSSQLRSQVATILRNFKSQLPVSLPATEK